MISARNVSVHVGGKRLIEHVTLDVPAGGVVALIGPNGAGKSTLFKALTGEARLCGGSILIDGCDVAALSPRDLAQRRAVVPQTSHLQFPFSVEEVVLLGASVPGFGHRDGGMRGAAAKAMAAADVAHLASRDYPTLSGGERQRVHLARALCQLWNAPPVGATRALLLDEPTSSLDIAHQLLILDAAREEARTGIAVLIVLHDFNLAARYADRIGLMWNGRLAALGSPEEIIDSGVLSQPFACGLQTNTVPSKGPFVLPQVCKVQLQRRN